MTAQVFGFPEKEGIAWHHLAPIVRQAALDRSGSAVIADRIVDVVGQAVKRSLPTKLKLSTESVDAMRNDVNAIYQQIVGAVVSELITLATDAEMLAVDHEPHNHRER